MHRRLCSRPLSVDLQKDGERQQQCEPKIGHMEAELRPEHRDEDQANHAGTCGHCPVEPQKRHGRAATRCRGCCRAGCAQATSHWSAAMLSASEKAHLLRQLVLVGAIQVVFFLGLKWLLKSTDPQSSRKAEGAVAGKRLMDRLARKGVKLSEYENMIACDVVDPADLTVGWEGVGGLEKTIATLKENIVLPFTRPDLFNSRLRRAPKGVLLFGPPGCGKTMTAKALAKECGCTFINLQPSTFMDKWYGESQKLIDALFSIAEKLQPCIIFIDEIDSFLRERQSADNEASAITKAQFMALWDGFATNAHQIVVVGATNRPFDVDKAILRRLPLTIHVKLPVCAVLLPEGTTHLLSPAHCAHVGLPGAAGCCPAREHIEGAFARRKPCTGRGHPGACRPYHRLFGERPRRALSKCGDARFACSVALGQRDRSPRRY
eukprot:m.122380 g.122380  ORF g.122380 m.122380 type:complete len:435 (+) comp9626_c0_seq2:995-2299(+)